MSSQYIYAYKYTVFHYFPLWASLDLTSLYSSGNTVWKPAMNAEVEFAGEPLAPPPPPPLSKSDFSSASHTVSSSFHNGKMARWYVCLKSVGSFFLSSSFNGKSHDGTIATACLFYAHLIYVFKCWFVQVHQCGNCRVSIWILDLTLTFWNESFFVHNKHIWLLLLENEVGML